MECPYCRIAFHERWHVGNIFSYNDSHGHQYSWSGVATVCPSCDEAIIDLRKTQLVGPSSHQEILRIRAYPRDSIRKPAPAEVPTTIKEDYDEACAVLPVSAKAAAALARRCLQAILREKGYLKRDLAQQIDDLLNEQDPTKAIPTSLRVTVDAIINFGNFSAHHVTDQTTLQVIPVEPGEAEWCLDILEEMFDHYYVKPAQAAARKTALDAKLKAAGKPPSK
jgi:hypothetical protein